MKECPKCIGAKVIKQPKKTRGFEYVDCNVCEGKGVVLDVLHQSFISVNRVFNDDLVGDGYAIYV